MKSFIHQSRLLLQSAKPQQHQLSIGLGGDTHDILPLDKLSIAPGNESLFSLLQAFLAGQVSSGAIYIWGRKGTGRSALLRGLCAQIPNTHTCYLEGSKSAGLLVGVEQWFARAELICIDDAELLTPDWLTVMASWIERAENQGLRLVIVGDHPPRAHEEGELRSLLSSLPSWQLHRLSEVQRRLMVAQWAKKEQVALSEAMLGSFLQRAPVSLSAMWQIWTKLLASASAGGITVKLIEEMAERRYQNGQ